MPITGFSQQDIFNLGLMTLQNMQTQSWQTSRPLSSSTLDFSNILNTNPAPTPAPTGFSFFNNNNTPALPFTNIWQPQPFSFFNSNPGVMPFNLQNPSATNGSLPFSAPAPLSTTVSPPLTTNINTGAVAAPATAIDPGQAFFDSLVKQNTLSTSNLPELQAVNALNTKKIIISNEVKAAALQSGVNSFVLDEIEKIDAPVGFAALESTVRRDLPVGSVFDARTGQAISLSTMGDGKIGLNKGDALPVVIAAAPAPGSSASAAVASTPAPALDPTAAKTAELVAQAAAIASTPLPAAAAPPAAVAPVPVPPAPRPAPSPSATTKESPAAPPEPPVRKRTMVDILGPK